MSEIVISYAIGFLAVLVPGVVCIYFQWRGLVKADRRIK